MDTAWQKRRSSPPTRERDVRSPWARDYARIIHSAAFRRLQSKTQVLDLGESDFYRTRLTHSMEVAQVGNGILQYLRQQGTGTPVERILPDAQLLAAICLAHDLGHPPFGHGGETALNYCMREYGGFEGNGQTLRILTRLEQYTEHHGLNPTRRLLLGVLKYPTPYGELVNPAAYGPDAATPRWLFKANEQGPPKCYLDTERDVVDWILEPLGTARQTFCAVADRGAHKHKKTLHKSLDTSIMDMADDISYALHDLEDAIAMGMLTRDMWEEFIAGKAGLFTDCGVTAEQVADDLFSHKEFRRKNRIGALVHYMITHTKIQGSGIATDCPLVVNRVCLEQNAAALQQLMGKLVADYVIFSPNVQLLEFRGQKIVVELFDVFASDAKRLLPRDVYARFAVDNTEGGRMRVLCDYIASMTDAGAARLHEKIFHVGKGSVFDRL